ncbi:MAG: hypothetical protein CMK59_12425 [Proteobacteria bacterium]|nr:hypothetical protein [Pseudomonadota bacterium]
MNQLEYISSTSTKIHEALEHWARELLREAGLETIEVYGQFPPEGAIASHIVLFPYRLGNSDTHLAQPHRETSLLGLDPSRIPTSGIPYIWRQIGKAISMCIHQKFPKMTKGPYVGRPHPAPRIDLLPEPLANWYHEQGDSGGENSWVTNIGGDLYARLPSLAWRSGVMIKIQYLIVVGAGARGTAERTAPIAVQALSILNAGMQFSNSISMRVPATPFDPKIASYAMAIAESLDHELGDELRLMLPDLDRKMDMALSLLPGASLTNADFTGLMQALQRPLQPTLHLALQANLGGLPVFAPGVSADLGTYQKERRSTGRT